ncbi:MAG TPA: hypothetical protein VIH40_02785, partial [Xanthobacteraceae bacterium]
TLFRCWMTFLSPFIARLLGTGRFDDERTGASTGETVPRFGAGFFQDLLGALAAAPAAGANAEHRRQIAQRAGAATGALAHFAFGDGVADADVHTRVLLECEVLSSKPMKFGNSFYCACTHSYITYCAIELKAESAVDISNENDYRSFR